MYGVGRAEFQIEITPAAPSFGTATIVDQEYTKGSAIAALTLPAATGGDTPVTYGLSPALPAGLAFDAATRTLSGTPTTAAEAATFTYTATDADGETASLTFAIAVGSAPTAMPTFGSETVSAQEYVAGEAIGALTLPAATGGDAPVTYGLSPVLPPGLAFDAATRTLSGTPTMEAAAATFTYTATDADGETASLTFTIAVGSAPSAMPSFGSEAVSAQDYVAGEAIATLTLPAATGGDAPVTYGLSPVLPAGLAFDAATRTLSGTPTMEAAAATFTYTATDADGETASLAFTIAVRSEPPAMLTDRDVLVALYNAIGGAGWTDGTNWLSAEPLGSWHGVTTDAAGRVTGLNLRNNGLSGSLSSALGSLGGLRSLFLYGNAGLTGALPVSLSALAQVQYFYAFGTGLCLPAALGAWHDAIQRKGAVPACTGEEAPMAPTFGSEAVSAQDYVAGEAIATLTLPAATGGDTPVTYGLSPALPAGLAFDAATRTLSGTPTMEAAAATFTYTATDADGETASLTFTIAVGSAPSAMPSFGSEAVSAQDYVAGEAIATLTLPAATGGDAPVTYGLSPVLPAGLAFDAATRTLSGTPTMEAAAATFTYTATDADGETASLAFTIAVRSEPPAMLTDRDVLVALYNATGGAGWTDGDELAERGATRVVARSDDGCGGSGDGSEPAQQRAFRFASLGAGQPGRSALAVPLRQCRSDGRAAGVALGACTGSVFLRLRDGSVPARRAGRLA